MPQLIQYLCPSWRLSLQGRPSALSQWVDRPVVHYDRAHLFRLSIEEDVPETLVWEGSAVELQELQDALQNYIQDLLQRSHHAFLQAEYALALVPALNPQELDAQELNPQELDAQELNPQELDSLELNALELNALELDRASNNPDPSENATPVGTSLTQISSSPKLRIETIGALGHRLWLSETIGLSLTTLECFDLAEVLDLWQTEALSLPPLPQNVSVRMPPWIKTAALILVTVGVSSTASTLGLQWWQNQQALDVARQSSSDQAVMSPDGLLLEPLDPLTMPQGSGLNAPNEFGELPGNTEVYGPHLPGEAPVSLGIAIRGEQPLPEGDFAGLPVPPPPDFSQLPPPPGEVYSGEVYTVLPPTEDYSDYGKNSGYTDNYSDYSASDYASLPAPAVLNATPETRSLPAAPQAIVPQGKVAESESSGSAATGDPSATIATVRSYFQGSWQPIESLTEPLQYQLLVGADGTLQAIIPLGDRAGNFLDRTGMPLLGESLSTPGQELLVTVVLRPDGSVEVY